MSRGPVHLFEGFGVELEYMIVERESLAVLPVADRVLHAIAGSYESEVEVGALCWSNEIVLHVIELKTNGPAPALEPLPARFQESVGRIGSLLEPLGGRLLGTGAHPWMDPEKETRLWPHEYSPVYAAFDRIFGCRGHGWANLQSVHLNLPFTGDEEFGRLHAAIRLVLPLLPGLAASTPFLDGRPTGLLDARLEAYRNNCRRIPSVSGRIVPEPVYTRRDYEEEIFRPMYRDVEPHDAEGVLRHEWLNARGAIARFDRDTIEIRLIDSQECAEADVAVCAAVCAAVQALARERWTGAGEQQAFDVAPLEAAFLRALAEGEEAALGDPAYAAQFGLKAGATVGEVWRHLADTLLAGTPWANPLSVILGRGTLARRILRAAGPDPGPARLRSVYRELADCLAEGRMFDGRPGA